MNKTIVLLLVITISLICLTRRINGDDFCGCTCCKDDSSCSPIFQGSFYLPSCKNYDCFIQCRTHYNACPPEGSSGKTEGRCTSTPIGDAHQHQPSIILLASLAFVIYGLFH